MVDIKRIASHSLTHVSAAFLMMGSWAVFANSAHPMPEPLIAGMVQGAMSGAITLVLKAGIEALSRRLIGLPALILPPAVAGITSLTLLTTIHTLAHTPEILATIAIPWTVATTYSAVYCYSIWADGETPND